MGFSIDKRRPATTDEIRFVPARWVVALVTLAAVLFRGTKVTKLSFGGLLWSLTPAPVKIAAAGVAAAGAIVVLGALAAIALLILQLS